MLSGTREKDTPKERSSSPREAQAAPIAQAPARDDATVLTGSDVAPASMGEEHSARMSAVLLVLVRSGRGTDAAADTSLCGKRGTDSLTTTSVGTLAPRRRGNRATPSGVV